jgi:nucleotide-binding universal stress UspA family protein
MKILIPYDGSSFSDAALDDLLRAGLPSEAEALVVSVSEVFVPVASHAGLVPALPGAEMLLHEKKDAQEMAQSAAQRINQSFPHWIVRAQGYAGSTVMEILTEADLWLPDLIVIGSHGRSALSRFFLGSVTMSVLHGARCPVRIVRGDVRRDQAPIKNIIGVDGSPFGAAVINLVTRREWPADTEFQVVTCYGPFRSEIEPGVFEPEKLFAEKARNEAVARLSAAGLKASGEALLDDPRRALIEVADAWKADCIYVGARGLNTFERILLGSVSSKVAGHAPCSVEVVRYPEKSVEAERYPEKLVSSYV